MFSKPFSDPTLFRKINNSARKVDNSILRVGSFLVSAGNSIPYGLGKPLTVLGKETARTVHKIRLGLEKASTKDLGKIKNNIYA
jgi:hypothetical protein